MKSSFSPECTRMYPNVPECTSVFGPNVPAALSHFATSLYYKFIREMQLMSRMCLNVPLFLLLECAWFQVPDQTRKLLLHCLLCALVQLSDSAHGLWRWHNLPDLALGSHQTRSVPCYYIA